MSSRCIQGRMKNETARHCSSAWSPHTTSLNYTVDENRRLISHSFGVCLLYLFMNAHSSQDNLFRFWSCVFCSTRRPRELLIQMAIMGWMRLMRRHVIERCPFCLSCFLLQSVGFIYIFTRGAKFSKLPFLVSSVHSYLFSEGQEVRIIGYLCLFPRNCGFWVLK